MSPRVQAWLFPIVGLLAALGGVAGYLAVRDAPAAAAPPAGIGDRRPAFSLPDIAGVTRDVAEWPDRVLVVNFWATWCPPCREEIPMFVELQAEYGPRGLQFVGIAIDERAPVAEFVTRYRVNYPVLTGGADAIDVATAWGNASGALPYSVVVDRAGTVVFQHRGELDRATLERVVAPLL